MKLCVECGTPCEGSRCENHKRRKAPQASATARGYGYAYQKLRAQAIAAQPFCSTCLTLGDASNPLGLDHHPEAWQKLASGKRLTMRDVAAGLLSVKCLRCNQRSGYARGRNITHE